MACFHHLLNQAQTGPEKVKYEACRTLAILGEYHLSPSGELEVTTGTVQPLSPLGKTEGRGVYTLSNLALGRVWELS